MKKDLEVVRDLIINIVKAYLPAKVAEINAEKNDGILIEDIPQTSYFSSFTDKANNSKEFLYYGYDTIDSVGIGPATKQVLTFFVVIFFSDLNSIDGTDELKSFRYSRAIEEIIQSNFANIGVVGSLNISQILPQNFRLNEDSALFKIGGVYMSINYA